MPDSVGSCACLRYMENYIVYFDSGTSNTRLYLLDQDMNRVCVKKRSIGSKDSAAAGSNRVLLEGLKQMYDEVLDENGLTDAQVNRIFASGMSTSPYGIKEIPHQVIPITVEQFAKDHPSFFEEEYFGRDIELIPGLKTVGDEISKVNNMRGEEIEIIGALEALPPECAGKSIAMIMPGSHTHTALVRDGCIQDILSTFSGELFYALKTSTVLAPVLSVPVEEFNAEQVKKGYENLIRYGFNRAIYICHAMRIFEEGGEVDRVSYAEGVIMGDILTALEQRCREDWKNCETAVIVCNREIYELFRILFEESCCIKKLIWLPISDDKSYALEGLKKIVKLG